MKWFNHPKSFLTRPGEMAAPLIQARGVGLTRQGQTILENISLQVNPGKIVVIIGPNGAGKTSVIRVMLGLWSATSGTVSRRASLRIGYMPQRIHIDPILPLSVRRFLTLRHRKNAGQLREVLARVGVESLLDAAVQTLSGGEMQRVLLARALLANPDLLVLDEPDQGVDVVGQGELFALIDTLRRDTGCGVLMVSHELHLVMAAADEVICMNRHVCCTGTPDEVSRDSEYRRLFPELALQGVAPYHHQHDHVHPIGDDAQHASTAKEHDHHVG
jgi:zinc transport system ATP-binding protein